MFYSPRHHARRGFTFTEVMFAVIILGVGFVMIAAILPVAIQQSISNVDETTASAMAQTAVNEMSLQLNQSINGLKTLPPTVAPADPLPNKQGTGGYNPNNPPDPALGAVYAISPNESRGLSPGLNSSYPIYSSTNLTAPWASIPQLFQVIQGNLINSGDPRFGYAVLYQRGGDSSKIANSFANLFVITLQSRNRSTYTAAGDTGFVNLNATPAPVLNAYSMCPKEVFVKLYWTSGASTTALAPNQIQFFKDSAGTIKFDEPRAGEGAFVVISDDQQTTGGTVGAANGRIYRLAARRDTDLAGNPATGLYELSPEYTINSSAEALPSPSTGKPLIGLIVGRGLQNPNMPEDETPGTATSNPADGAVQDVSIYKTIVPLQ